VLVERRVSHLSVRNAELVHVVVVHLENWYWYGRIAERCGKVTIVFEEDGNYTSDNIAKHFRLL